MANSLNILSDRTFAAYDDTPGNAEFKRLVAKLDVLKNGKNQQTILITSAIIGEGKSTVASYVAQSAAYYRKQSALLIDFDIRRPRLHEVFNVRREKGVVDILNDGIPLVSCCKKTAIDNLFLVTAGKTDLNPNELLTSDRIKNLISEARTHFEYAIVDSPPIIPVSDPLLISRFVDNVILVIKAGSTLRHVVKRAIDMLFDIRVEVSGFVLNNMNNVLPRYYDYKYYGYKYYEKPIIELESSES